MLNNYIDRYIQNYKRDIRNGKIANWQEYKKEIVKVRGYAFLKSIKDHWANAK